MNELSVKREDGMIWSHIRNRWLVETPEEAVRQTYLLTLVNEYGFKLNQMDEELEVTGRGSGRARADFVIWRTAQDKADSRNPLIVVECKSDNVTISVADYGQGDNYSRLTGARFFVTRNSRETRFWRVVHELMPKSQEEIDNIPHAAASDKEIEELVSRLKVFKEDEFARLLHECHNIIRNREKLDPAAAFDEIAKILFVKVYVEKELKSKRARRNLFSVEILDEQIGRHPLNTLFEQTKAAYRDDRIFDKDDEIRLRPATGREIVKLLERYNLSDTGEDIKGIAFERFLGRTFRGEIGQFFTPRTIVEFMIRMVEPREGELICDPASGSGGFLIRFFEIVREQVLSDADREYQAFRAKLATEGLSESDEAEALRKKYAEIQHSIDPRREGSRLWELANRRIYGTDANDRMARTSKMNMIMHGDGHGGVHHHDGFLDANGVFEGRFDIVLTNPPFGSMVDASDTVHESDVDDYETAKRNAGVYGDRYAAARARLQATIGKPITSLFDLPNGPRSKIKTEVLFLERCLALLKPGGRLGIVLPEGVFNNPSLARVREFCEDKAFIRAVVSLPQETFYSSGASVKASLLFLQKFTEAEQDDFNLRCSEAQRSVGAEHAEAMAPKVSRLEADIESARAAGARTQVTATTKELAQLKKKWATDSERESRKRLKELFSYLIFMYEAEKVGITATGEDDQNELCRWPRDNVPADLECTCLELYQDFRQDPSSFLLDQGAQ